MRRDSTLTASGYYDRKKAGAVSYLYYLPSSSALSLDVALAFKIGTCRLATSRYLPSLAEATMYALDAPLLGDGHLDGWTFGSGDGAEGLPSGVATKWVDLSTQNRAMQEELYPKAVLRRPCGSFFTKTTDVGQDLTWNNAKPSIKALTGKVEGAIG